MSVYLLHLSDTWEQSQPKGVLWEQGHGYRGASTPETQTHHSPQTGPSARHPHPETGGDPATFILLSLLPPPLGTGLCLPLSPSPLLLLLRPPSRSLPLPLWSPFASRHSGLAGALTRTGLSLSSRPLNARGPTLLSPGSSSCPKVTPILCVVP